MADAVPKAKKIWLDGKFVDWDNAKIHLLTHSLHYSTAVFEGIRCYKTQKAPAIFRLEDHIERLFYGWATFKKELKYSKEQIVAVCKEIVRINNFQECYIRPIIFLGYGYMGINPIPAPVSMGIIAWKWEAYLGEKAREDGVSLKVSRYLRQHPSKILDKKFSANYLQSALAKQEAIKDGFDDAIFLNTDSYISEGTGENIFIVKDGKLITPPADAILKGITRDSVITIARDFGIPIEEKKLSIEDFFSADEVLLTGTAAEVVGVTKIDDRKISNGKPGQITKKLQSKFYDIVAGRDLSYKRWLDYV